LDRADADYDLRNVFTANGVAPIPNIHRGGAWTSILRDWSFNNIISVRSGIPFTPIVGGDTLGLGGTATFQFPDRVTYNRSCTFKHNINYIDTSCFAFPGNDELVANPALNYPRLGTGRRNTLQGPGLFEWDTGLMKDQRITERVRAQFQFQMFNTSNHTNFADPASAQNQIYSSTGALSGTAGQLTAVATPGRQLQFALKIIF
jgi:hypothetical protein